jgi:ABC-type polysaccharide/polyol phosphate export permease
MATRSRTHSLPLAVSEVWRHRELLRHLMLRNLKVKYKRSILGFAWTLLNPLLMVGVIVVVFGFILEVPVTAYWAFLFSGYFVWNFILQTLNSSTTLLTEHSALLRSVPVPGEVLVVAAAGSRLVEFGIEKSFAIVALLLIHHQGVPTELAWLPVFLVLQIMLTVGLVLPIATLSVFYDDVQHALPVALLMLFYISPVLYPVEMVPEALLGAYFLNPIAGLMTLYQTVLYEGAAPSWGVLWWTSSLSVIFFLGGLLIFRRYRSVFPEIL